MFKAFKPNMNIFVFLVFGILLFPPIEHTAISSKFHFFLFTPPKSELDLDVMFFEALLAFAVSVLAALLMKRIKNHREKKLVDLTHC